MTGETIRIALITGAGSGIGRATSLALAGDGYRIVLAGRRLKALIEVEQLIQRQGGQALAVATDVSIPGSVEALFECVHREYGRLDLLFNNAGTNALAATLDELSVSAWQSVLDVNLTGAFLCTRQAFRLMKSQHPRGGRIINNGSVSSNYPRLNAAAYTASKHGLTGLTRAAALEGRAFDIACGQIDIGNVATAIGAHIVEGTLQADGSRASEPTMELQQVAEAVRYMANLPLSANVLFMTVMATRMPLLGRG